jgi:hypothetical protein
VKIYVAAAEDQWRRSGKRKQRIRGGAVEALRKKETED